MNELYQATQAVFGDTYFFDQDWHAGTRPAIENWRDTEGEDHQDILYLNPYGSYIRRRGSEKARWGVGPAFDRLYAMLAERRMYADR